jgi:hypothetical protein
MNIVMYANGCTLSLSPVPRKLNNAPQPVIRKTIPTQKIPAQYSPENPKMLVDRKKTLRMLKEIENITIRPRKTRSTRWSIVASHLSPHDQYIESIDRNQSLIY